MVSFTIYQNFWANSKFKKISTNASRLAVNLAFKLKSFQIFRFGKFRVFHFSFRAMKTSHCFNLSNRAFGRQGLKFRNFK